MPPGCTSECVTASNNGTYPQVWNNDAVDASFGITSPLYLDQITPNGELLGTIEVPNSTQNGVPATKDQMVTSFSSKSEGALNLATDGSAVTFMGYLAPVNALDVSNSNTPGVIDPTDPVSGAYSRVIAELGANGKFHFTKTNAYSGNNGRAAILNREEGADVLYMAGNAGNGSNPQPSGIVTGGGAQIATPQVKALVAQEPGLPTPVGAFSVTQLGAKQDKIGKDTNFRGLTIYDNVLYYTKGSGSNGVNTVYFVDTTGHACPNGVGLPEPGAKLPTEPLAYEPEKLGESGLTPQNMCILKGFPTALKSKTSFPFGIWFANPTTLYVADEGNGEAEYSTATGTYTKAAASKTAGLQKWVLENGSWKLAYTLQGGLELGKPYTVAGYPTGDNEATGLPWAPATDGLRNITGRVNLDGTATIWGITSTVSGNGDQGADPNKLVGITDDVGATSLPAGESFQTTRAAGFGEVLRGVSLTPTGH
ncbi:MAG: hypothetical protein JSS97_17745 [Actinobacteria bacterium]|nr:hypothetical protein [Actinomycetota bacterium]